MKLGISSYTYTWAIGIPDHLPSLPMTAVELVDRAASLGVRVVQVADNLPLDRLSLRELQSLADHAAELGIDIEVGTRGIEHDHLQTYLRLAERYHSPILRVVVDTIDQHPSEDQVVSTIKAIVPELESVDISLAIENHDRFKARTLARIIERIGSQHVGICLDTANSLGALEGPEVVVATLGPWVVNLHVKDIRIQRPSHMMGFAIEGRPAGQGQLNIPWLLHELRTLGKSPNAILELWTPPELSLSDTIAKEEEWASSSVTYLRQLIPN